MLNNLTSLSHPPYTIPFILFIYANCPSAIKWVRVRRQGFFEVNLSSPQKREPSRQLCTECSGDSSECKVAIRDLKRPR